MHDGMSADKDVSLNSILTEQTNKRTIVPNWSCRSVCSEQGILTEDSLPQSGSLPPLFPRLTSLTLKSRRNGSENTKQRPDVTGLHVGASNVRRYFPRNARLSSCIWIISRYSVGSGLTFRRTSPRFSTRDLCMVGVQDYHTRADHAPIPLAMIPAGKNSFRIRPVSFNEETQHPAPLPAKSEFLSDSSVWQEQTSAA